MQQKHFSRYKYFYQSRAKLFNVGVIEGIFYQEIRNHNLANGSQNVCYCIILHDVDMLPVRISMEIIFQDPEISETITSKILNFCVNRSLFSKAN